MPVKTGYKYSQKKTYLKVTCEKYNTCESEKLGSVNKYTEKVFEYGLVPGVLKFGEFTACSSRTSIRKQENILTLQATC